MRDDYSATGDVWHSFPHDHARSRAYRWGEDGLLGIADHQCRLAFALALWNGRDPILKERLFGLANPEGNHGEDVKELYYYRDATPTASYLAALYRYPQVASPYTDLVASNPARTGKKAAPVHKLEFGPGGQAVVVCGSGPTIPTCGQSPNPSDAASTPSSPAGSPCERWLKSAACGGVARPVEKCSAQVRCGVGQENRGEAAISPYRERARGVYAAMEMWTQVRRRVLTGELSKGAACRVGSPTGISPVSGKR